MLATNGHRVNQVRQILNNSKSSANDIQNIKNVQCDYRQSYCLIAVQLTQDKSRSWMVIHAKFQKIS